MAENIESFSIKQYLQDTYPSNDDSEAIQKAIDFLSLGLSKKRHINGKEMDHFLKTLVPRLRVISKICMKYSDMDDMETAEVSIIDDICQTIEDDLANILKEDDVMQIYKGAYFIDLKAFPDAIKFYHHLSVNNKLSNSISRRAMEKIYIECSLSSNFSNVLFILSWLDLLRVYSTNFVYFNNRRTLYF